MRLIKKLGQEIKTIEIGPKLLELTEKTLTMKNMLRKIGQMCRILFHNCNPHTQKKSSEIF